MNLPSVAEITEMDAPALLAALVAAVAAQGEVATVIGAIATRLAYLESQKPEMEDELLDLATAAKRLACSKDWLRRNGDALGIAIRLGAGQLRFSRVAIDTLLAERRQLAARADPEREPEARRGGDPPRRAANRQLVGSSG